ncbi:MULTISPECIES: dephospho-CoA kinase [Parasutterella]|jgi:dephospho-coA kinase|uniref:dephospho-CoA kinase n=1 Tax=Parasutterella TaxID=577310 RepID=UPI0027BA9314|nr:dephospho-CoA kinase [Parasutterella excrementihominis]
MKVIGLTGGIGSGKTTVSDLFSELGIDVVDADVVSRQLTAADGGAMLEIIKQFGPEAASPDGSMNRRFMRELVFSDPSAKTALENILHALIRRECQRQLDASKSPYTILSVPLLIESPFWRSSIDRLLVVEAPEALRIERVVRRSNLTSEAVKKIISTQATTAQRLNAADDVMENVGTREMLKSSVLKLHSMYLFLAKKD